MPSVFSLNLYMQPLLRTSNNYAQRFCIRIVADYGTSIFQVTEIFIRATMSYLLLSRLLFLYGVTQCTLLFLYYFLSYRSCFCFNFYK